MSSSILLEMEDIIYKELELYQESALKIINEDQKLSIYDSFNIRNILVQQTIDNSSQIAKKILERHLDFEIKINSVIERIMTYEFEYEISAIENMRLYIKKKGAEESLESRDLYLGNGETLRLGREKLHYTNLFISEYKYGVTLQEEILEKKVISKIVTRVLNEAEYGEVFKKLNIATNELKIINYCVSGLIPRGSKIKAPEFPVTKINLLEDNYESLLELSTFFAIVTDRGFNLEKYTNLKKDNSISNNNINKVGL